MPRIFRDKATGQLHDGYPELGLQRPFSPPPTPSFRDIEDQEKATQLVRFLEEMVLSRTRKPGESDDEFMDRIHVPPTMTLSEMKRRAIPIRPTAWQRVLDDEDEK